MAKVITACGPKRYVLVGHSMGGKVAPLLASRRPAGLAGLVLVAPSRASEDNLRGAPAAKVAWPTASIAENVSADLAKIAVPTLVLAGENDRVDPVAILESEVVARIPGATMRILPGTGHLSPLEVPGLLAEAVAIFAMKLST